MPSVLFEFIIVIFIVLPASIYMHHACVRCPRSLEEGIGFPGTGIGLVVSHHIGAGN